MALNDLREKLIDTDVIIYWVDSKIASMVWEHKEEMESVLPVDCRTLGTIAEVEATHITVVGTMGDKQVLGRIAIPFGSIQEILKITEIPNDVLYKKDMEKTNASE